MRTSDIVLGLSIGGLVTYEAITLSIIEEVRKEGNEGYWEQLIQDHPWLGVVFGGVAWAAKIYYDGE